MNAIERGLGSAKPLTLYGVEVEGTIKANGIMSGVQGQVPSRGDLHSTVRIAGYHNGNGTRAGAWRWQPVAISTPKLLDSRWARLSRRHEQSATSGYRASD